MRHLTRLLASAILVTFVAAAAWSSEADELRAKAKLIQREADQLRKQGRSEEAEKLSREVKELLHAAEEHEKRPSGNSERAIDELHQRLKVLAEKEQQAEESKNKNALVELRKHRADVERELADLHEQKPDAKKHSAKKHSSEPELTHEAARRIEHLHIAIKNLHAAGFHDVAEDLAKKAEGMERERSQVHEKIMKAQPSPVKTGGPNQLPKFLKEETSLPSPKKGQQVEAKIHNSDWERKVTPEHAPIVELRNELQRLRAELNELREEIKKRP